MRSAAVHKGQRQGTHPGQVDTHSPSRCRLSYMFTLTLQAKVAQTWPISDVFTVVWTAKTAFICVSKLDAHLVFRVGSVWTVMSHFIWVYVRCLRGQEAVRSDVNNAWNKTSLYHFILILLAQNAQQHTQTWCPFELNYSFIKSCSMNSVFSLQSL